jgi:hypothetical protein
MTTVNVIFYQKYLITANLVVYNQILEGVNS